MKTCGGREVFGEQADEEMTLRPPCSVGERVIHSRWRPIGPGDDSGLTGIGQRWDDPVRGLWSSAEGATRREALLMWELAEDSVSDALEEVSRRWVEWLSWFNTIDFGWEASVG